MLSTASGGDDTGVFHHEHDRSLRSARAMQNSLGDHHALPRTEFHGAAFEINQQLSFDDVEELIIVIMLVPVIFALHHTETNYGAVHLAMRLVVPLVSAGIGEGAFVNYFQW